MSDGIEAWLEEGLRYYSQGDPSRALEAWYRILDADPNHSLAQQYVAYVRQVYRLEVPSPGAAGGPTAPVAAPATAGLQQTAPLRVNNLMPSPAVPAGESLPPAPADPKKSIVGFDVSSSWSDVVDSAFDAAPGAKPAAAPPPPPLQPLPPPPAAVVAQATPLPAPAAAAGAVPAPKMATNNPWAAPSARPGAKPSPADLPPPTAMPPMPPAAAPAVVRPAATPANGADPWSAPSMPGPPPPGRVDGPVPAPPAAVFGLTGQVIGDGIEELGAAMPPPSFAAPPTEPVRKPVLPGATPASDMSGFDPWRGDTLPPIAPPAMTPSDALDLPPTPPPVELEIDLAGAMLPPPPAAFSPAVAAAASATAAPAAASPTPAWKTNAVDEVKPGVHRGVANRVDVVPADTPSPSARGDAASALRGPVEERMVKPSVRYGDYESLPSKPTARPSPPVSQPVQVSSAADEVGSLDMSLDDVPLGGVGSGDGASSLAAARPPSAATGNGSSNTANNNASKSGSLDAILNPWDEVGGPGAALDLDRTAAPASKFEQLLGASPPGAGSPWPAAAEPTPEPPSPEDPTTELMRGARELFDLGDFSGSLDLVEKVLKMDAQNEAAHAYMRKNEQTLIKMYESKIGDMHRTPQQLIPPDEVIWMNMHHKAGFILSQIDGNVTFADILEISGMGKFDTMRILHELVQQGIIG